MNEQLENAISALSHQLTDLETMIETYHEQHNHVRDDLLIVNRMLKQCTRMKTPNGLKQSIEDHQCLLAGTLSAFKTQIKDCKLEQTRIVRALSILNV